jgi:hypothetical protein
MLMLCATARMSRTPAGHFGILSGPPRAWVHLEALKLLIQHTPSLSGALNAGLTNKTLVSFINPLNNPCGGATERVMPPADAAKCGKPGAIRWHWSACLVLYDRFFIDTVRTVEVLCKAGVDMPARAPPNPPSSTMWKDADTAVTLTHPKRYS